MSQVTFYLKNPTAKNKSAIYASFAYDSKRIQTSTKWSIDPKFWDRRKGTLKHQYSHLPFYQIYIEHLDKIKSKIIDYYQNQKVKGIIPDVSSIKRELEQTFVEKEEEKINNEFFDVLEKFIKSNPEKSILTIRKYETIKQLLIEFKTKKQKSISFELIDLEFLDEFTNHLFNRPNQMSPDTPGLKDDTVHKYLAVLKTFLKWSLNRGYHQNSIYQSFASPRLRKHEIVTLTTDEIKSLEELNLKNNTRLEKVRDLFLFAYYTGQRWSRFNKNDLIMDPITKDYYWQFRVYKTKKIITIPFVGRILPALLIIKKYNFEFPVISRQKFNDFLKEVGQTAELNRIVRIKRYSGSKHIIIEKNLYDFMSSHMARRTCVTHLLEDGIPPTTVMKLTDHQGLNTILKYENTSLNALKNALMKNVS